MFHRRLTTAALAAAVLVATAPVAFAARQTCIGDCDANGEVGITDLVTLIDAALGVTETTTCDVEGAAGVEHVVLAVNHAHGGCPLAGTPTPTPTPTRTPTHDPNALGRRRFEINPATSTFSMTVASGTTIPLGNFVGQSNGVAEHAFLELEAGAPDPVTHVASIDVTSSSDYLVAPVDALGANFIVCSRRRGTPPPSIATVAAITRSVCTGITTSANLGSTDLPPISARRSTVSSRGAHDCARPARSWRNAAPTATATPRHRQAMASAGWRRRRASPRRRWRPAATTATATASRVREMVNAGRLDRISVSATARLLRSPAPATPARARSPLLSSAASWGCRPHSISRTHCRAATKDRGSRCRSR